VARWVAARCARCACFAQFRVTVLRRQAPHDRPAAVEDRTSGPWTNAQAAGQPGRAVASAAPRGALLLL
jgi:hypothetical protein